MQVPGNLGRIPIPETYHIARRKSASCGAAKGKNNKKNRKIPRITKHASITYQYVIIKIMGNCPWIFSNQSSTNKGFVYVCK